MRIEKVEYQVYKFEELSDKAKEKARQWYREGTEFEPDFEDVKTIGKMLGINISRILYSGFCSQGDGACFEGSYSFTYDAIKNVREYAPLDERLFSIACQLDAIQSRHDNKLTATVEQSGRYYNPGNTTIYIENGGEEFIDQNDVSALEETLKDFMHWIYRQLESEYEYQMSDESIDESILANDYDFLESGKVF